MLQHPNQLLIELWEKGTFALGNINLFMKSPKRTLIEGYNLLNELWPNASPRFCEKNCLFGWMQLYPEGKCESEYCKSETITVCAAIITMAKHSTYKLVKQWTLRDLSKFLLKKGRRKDQQDRAPPHFSRIARAWMDENFHRRGFQG